MNTYPCPDWLKCRKITDSEYGRWLTSQTASIWRRETRSGRSNFAEPHQLKQALHAAALKSTGYDPYSGARFYIKHLRTGWVDILADLRGNRHYLTLRRCMPTFDHVRGLAGKEYELCTRETNAAKSFMSPKQFIALCNKISAHQAINPRQN